MPVLIGRNTNGPAMMIGEKGADLVKGKQAVVSIAPLAAVVGIEKIQVTRWSGRNAVSDVE